METNTIMLELGRRISEIRKEKGFTQDEVAKSIGMSRSSLTQMELGKRGLDVFELKALSTLLGFSIDSLFANETVLREDAAVYERITKKPNQVRISVPKLQVEKFRNVLLYILERCAGKPNVGETVLYKLLYFSDFNYYELYEEQLTGAEYRKLPHGPVPLRMNVILKEMLDNGQLQRIKTDYHGFPQTRYLPLRKADLTTMKASEKVVIDGVIDQMSDWNAATISQYSHGDKPWKATDANSSIDYELVFYRQPPYSVRVYEDDEQD